MLLSQRITRLTGLIVGDLKKSQALADFDSFTADRNDIVHGRGKVHIDGEGEWFLTLETVDRAGFAVRNIDRAEAEIFTKRLKVSVDRLATALTA